MSYQRRKKEFKGKANRPSFQPRLGDPNYQVVLNSKLSGMLSKSEITEIRIRYMPGYTMCSVMPTAKFHEKFCGEKEQDLIKSSFLDDETVPFHIFKTLDNMKAERLRMATQNKIAIQRMEKRSKDLFNAYRATSASLRERFKQGDSPVREWILANFDQNAVNILALSEKEYVNIGLPMVEDPFALKLRIKAETLYNKLAEKKIPKLDWADQVDLKEKVSDWKFPADEFLALVEGTEMLPAINFRRLWTDYIRSRDFSPEGHLPEFLVDGALVFKKSSEILDLLIQDLKTNFVSKSETSTDQEG